jgi:glycosyltransferase involved in cell wall biosynthesis
MVVPIFGPGGTRLKVLEAFAAGLPVISTSIGVAGLDVVHGKHALVSDTADGLANEAVRLLKNSTLAKKLGDNGQEFVEKQYDWKTIVKLHDQIYRKLLKQ